MPTKEELQNSPPGVTAERTNTTVFQAGLYRHPITGAEVVTLSDPLYGDTQSEAFVRVGFVRVGDAPEGYVKTVVQASESAAQSPAAVADQTTKIMSDLQARVNALEGDNARLQQRQPASFPGAGARMAEAADRGANIGQNDTNVLGISSSNTPFTGDTNVVGQGISPVTGNQDQRQVPENQEPAGNEAPPAEPALTEMKREDLDSLAAQEGVENPEQFPNKPELAAAVEAKRAEQPPAQPTGSPEGAPETASTQGGGE